MTLQGSASGRQCFLRTTPASCNFWTLQYTTCKAAPYKSHCCVAHVPVSVTMSPIDPLDWMLRGLSNAAITTCSGNSSTNTNSLTVTTGTDNLPWHWHPFMISLLVPPPQHCWTFLRLVTTLTNVMVPCADILADQKPEKVFVLKWAPQVTTAMRTLQEDSCSVRDSSCKTHLGSCFCRLFCYCSELLIRDMAGIHSDRSPAARSERPALGNEGLGSCRSSQTMM